MIAPTDVGYEEPESNVAPVVLVGTGYGYRKAWPYEATPTAQDVATYKQPMQRIGTDTALDALRTPATAYCKLAQADRRSNGLLMGMIAGWSFAVALAVLVGFLLTR